MADQLDLFTDQSACTYPGCGEPATHGARCTWVRGGNDPGVPVTTGLASRNCCRWHANYFATAWAGLLWPGSRDVTWIEILTEKVR